MAFHGWAALWHGRGTWHSARLELISFSWPSPSQTVPLWSLSVSGSTIHSPGHPGIHPSSFLWVAVLIQSLIQPRKGSSQAPLNSGWSLHLVDTMVVQDANVLYLDSWDILPNGSSASTGVLLRQSNDHNIATRLLLEGKSCHTNRTT